jgi:hypothetical protein
MAPSARVLQCPFANAFAYDIADNIPDQHAINFDLTVTDGSSNTWHSAIYQLVNAPDLADHFTRH